MTYPDTQLFINGAWLDAGDGRTLAVLNPATGQQIGRVAHAGKAELDQALQAAQKGFETWRDMSPAERSQIMRRAASLMRERADAIAHVPVDVKTVAAKSLLLRRSVGLVDSGSLVFPD